METQIDASLRHIKGFVPIDLALLSDNADFTQYALFDLENNQQPAYDAGKYQAEIPFAPLGNLARTDPDGYSPIIPGFTNFQACMFLAAGPFIPNVTFHYYAGIWDGDQITGLQYATLDELYEFLETAIPYQPTKFFVDYGSMQAGLETPFDDHFGDIAIPILNIAVAGGFGELSKYQFSLVGSTDITHLIPTTHPPGEEVFDFGHIDIFVANNAESVVWEGLLGWIEGNVPKVNGIYS